MATQSSHHNTTRGNTKFTSLSEKKRNVWFEGGTSVKAECAWLPNSSTRVPASSTTSPQRIVYCWSIGYQDIWLPARQRMLFTDIPSRGRVFVIPCAFYFTAAHDQLETSNKGLLLTAPKPFLGVKGGGGTQHPLSNRENCFLFWF